MISSVVLKGLLHVIEDFQYMVGGLRHGDDGCGGLQQVAVPFPALSW
jgi:hypothetical protein